MTKPAASEVAAQIAEIIANCALTPHFQPIVDIANAQILGFEGLTRGPSDSYLHSPVTLFEAAEASGQLFSLERCAINSIVTAFSRLKLPGRLFVNVTPRTIVQDGGLHQALAEMMTAAGVPASSIVIELTETHAGGDLDQLLEAIEALRKSGFVVALDDLGEGFSSLKRWTEVRPDFVKIDRHFVDGLAQDPLRQQFIRSILDMARTATCHVVAEGVENESDLLVLRELGMHSVQGYFIARPAASPRTTLRPDIVRLLTRDAGSRAGARTQQRAGSLARQSVTVPEETTCETVLGLFRDNAQLYAIPVLDANNRPVGLLRSLDVLAQASKLFFLELYSKRSCRIMMDTKPLVFDIETTLTSMASAVAHIEERHLIDGFIVTQSGFYWGTGRISDLLRSVSESQVSAARYSNPLTQLPGNVPLDEHVDGLLDQRVPFVVAHWDIGAFKAFNDVYGYRVGDDMIVFTGETLLAITDPESDMLGHVGGDDFVSVFTSQDWISRVQDALRRFDEGSRRFYLPEHLSAGGYVTRNRQGQDVFQPLATLAAGVVPVYPGTYESHRQIGRAAADTKRMAKASGTSTFFVERRTTGSSDVKTGGDGRSIEGH